LAMVFNAVESAFSPESGIKKLGITYLLLSSKVGAGLRGRLVDQLD
jgi:hypothetical protein